MGGPAASFLTCWEFAFTRVRHLQTIPPQVQVKPAGALAPGSASKTHTLRPPQTCPIDTSSSARRPADGTERHEGDPTALLTGHWPQPS